MDFKKETLAKILKDIANAYGSISEMSNRIEMNRSHLSQYINQQMSTPPKPNTLKKIAENSKGITNYNELMSICGYEEMTDEYNLLLAGDIKYADLYFRGQNISKSEKIEEIERLIKNLENYIKSCETMIQSNKDNTFGDYYINLYKSDLGRAKKEINGFTKILQKLKEE